MSRELEQEDFEGFEFTNKSSIRDVFLDVCRVAHKILSPQEKQLLLQLVVIPGKTTVGP